MKDYNKEPNYIHACDSKMLDEVYRDVFRIGYEQAEKDTIDRACKWLEENVVIYPYGKPLCIINLDTFRKAMEGE